MGRKKFYVSSQVRIDKIFIKNKNLNGLIKTHYHRKWLKTDIVSAKWSFADVKSVHYIKKILYSFIVTVKTTILYIVSQT